MSRLFITSDNQAARAELIQDPETGRWSAFCVGCISGGDTSANDLLYDTHEQFNLNDAAEETALHVDRCTRCADPDCRTEGRHDAGHRCRKD